MCINGKKSALKTEEAENSSFDHQLDVIVSVLHRRNVFPHDPVTL